MQQQLSALVEGYCDQLRRRQIEGSFQCAKRTAEIMRLLITTQRHADAASLIEDVRTVGTKLQAAKPVELVIGNIVRRVLHMIREEEEQGGDEDGAGGAGAHEAEEHQPGLLSQALRGPASRVFINRAVSLSNLLDQRPAEGPLAAMGTSSGGGAQPQAGSSGGGASASASASAADDGGGGEGGARRRVRSAPQWQHKQTVIELLNELIDELDGIEAQIAHQAVEHIHANEVILTYGMSDTVLLFLKEASKKREFQVVVAEAAPRYDGHRMARALAAAGVQTTLIADSAVFAMMARVNKVLVGAHAVLANGGVIAPSGSHVVAAAARRHSVPLVVLVGLHKLSPLFPHDPDVAFNEFKSPADVVDFDVLAEAFVRRDEGADTVNVEVCNPCFDYVPPHLVSLFLTDTGGYTPSYVYRLLAEYYSREDYLLSAELLNLINK
ncbi:translation initiation factor eIF-2B subunit beta [Raphidocelis subcapitata]|uniref:Translation initiation factor eIF2B subunit beta n=1 Tax=Raphidocelis subcapitata TaxID=307507 RepID=A0A2V0NN15_9CHLO|nr:translation initiation factor eIF-2B subunit beta [Raphidocelis subcapitata]|eukprot:GBF88924.1 translation initiation factor eIF-2B subunit beta [Raphidocelis subcapitata]